MRISEFRVRDGYRRILARALVFAVASVSWGFTGIHLAHCQETEENQPVGSETEEEEAKEVRPTIDLGVFSVKDFRPSQNETVKVSFKLHLALDESVQESTVEQLENWQHRLRNQVLVAIRLSETIDFLEPDLNKFRRTISMRINRLLQAIFVSETMLTEFTFSTT